MLKPRKCLLTLPEYRTPVSTMPLELRLDLNESTTGCSPRVLEKIRAMDAQKLALYAPRDAGEQIAGAILGRPPANLLLTNGGDEAIDIFCRGYLEPETEAIIITPAFSMYEIFAQATGAKIVNVPMGPEYTFPEDEVIAAITPATRAIFITNPHNPSGSVMLSNTIMKILNAAPDAAVLVDEAYFDFYGQTMMDVVGKVPNLFVLRTFSKAYGLAGVRIGVLAGAANHMAVLRRVPSPFNVNAFALECLQAALADRKFVNDYVAQVKQTREWFTKELEELGFLVYPSSANFVFVNFGQLKAKVLEQMTQWGIALRDRADCEGCVRITIGRQKEMEVVAMGLNQILNNLMPKADPDAEPEAEQEQPAP
jgi:histidinol-phosphate aminotransferase